MRPRRFLLALVMAAACGPSGDTVIAETAAQVRVSPPVQKTFEDGASCVRDDQCSSAICNRVESRCRPPRSVGGTCARGAECLQVDVLAGAPTALACILEEGAPRFQTCVARAELGAACESHSHCNDWYSFERVAHADELAVRCAPSLAWLPGQAPTPDAIAPPLSVCRWVTSPRCGFGPDGRHQMCAVVGDACRVDSDCLHDADSADQLCANAEERTGDSDDGTFTESSHGVCVADAATG